MAKVISFTNQKGGVGKTTTCAGLCGCLSKLGKKVLALDLDPQGNLSFSLGAETDSSYTIYDVFKSRADIYDTVQHCSCCDVIPANILLSGVELELTSVGREYILREHLSTISDEYDYVLVDTPPALSILTINAYAASDQLVIPMVPEILSLQGIAQLKETIFAVKKYYNQSLEIRGILLNKYSPRLVLTKPIHLRDNRIRQHYIQPGILDIGVTTMTRRDATIRIYDRERMLIELLRNKNKLPFDYYKEILGNYRGLIDELDIERVQEYAATFPKPRMISEALDAEVF